MGNVKNNNALLIYQTLVFALKEIHTNIDMRDFYYNNFVDVFDIDKSIPLHVLIEPLVNTIR